jgi:uncharacterized RDD family membrane protein YckC
VNDPLRDVIEVETPENVIVRFEVAGLGRRSIAAGIDVLVMTGISVLLVLVGGAIMAAAGIVIRQDALAGFGALAMAIFLVWWSYFIVCEMTMNGQSIGKRRSRIRVVRVDGGEITFLHSAIRNLLRAVDWLPMLYGVGSVTVLLTKRCQRLGDLAAGTVVVVQDPEAPPEYLLTDIDRLPLPEELRQGIIARVGAVRPEEYDYAIRLLSRLPEHYLVNPQDAQWLAWQTAATLLQRFQLPIDKPLDYLLSVSIIQCTVAAYGRRAVAR